MAVQNQDERRVSLQDFLRPFFYSRSYFVLSPGQTIATCQRNISQRCWAQHVARVWPPCCAVLRHVGCCWLKFDHLQT